MQVASAQWHNADVPKQQDLATPAGRRALARMMASACITAVPDLPLEDVICAVIDEADDLARLVGRHIASSPREAYEPKPPGSIYALLAPRTLVLEMRKELGPRLTKSLKAPLAARRMRVLLLAPRRRHVIDVIPRRDAFRIEEEEQGEQEAPTRDVSGTWKDPVRYLPMPLPEEWSVGDYDRVGALRVVVGGRLRLDIGLVDMDGRRVMFVMARPQGGDGKPADDEVVGALDRLRHVRGGFKEMTEVIPEIPEMGGDASTRLFASRVNDTVGSQS